MCIDGRASLIQWFDFTFVSFKFTVAERAQHKYKFDQMLCRNGNAQWQCNDRKAESESKRVESKRLLFDESLKLLANLMDKLKLWNDITKWHKETT